MVDILLIPVAIIYLLIVILLFIFGLNFLYLTILALRNRRRTPPPPLKVWPKVTVQLPIYNELYVVERLINAVANMDYPSDLLEIQVLDDSTDETVELIQRTIERLRPCNINILHLHRTKRDGFKAGALAEGFKTAQGEFLVIFDADFIPPPDFLRKTLPYFNDPKVAFVQTRWSHINSSYSLITRLQSLAIDGHFMIEQLARSSGKYFFNFNGTGGVWRKSAIEDAGGWKSDTLTEDLDLSYRAFLHNWQAVYLENLEVPGELPVSFNAYRKQQHRWARGSLECAAKLIPEVWKSDIPFWLKVEATLHLTGYGIHLLMFTLAALYPAVLILSQRYPGLTALFGISFILNATAFAPTLLFFIAQLKLGHNGLRQLPSILFLTILGSGMVINTLRAALQIFWGRKMVFERTPKFGIQNKKQDWTKNRYQTHFDFIVIAELIFALWNAQTVWLAMQSGNDLISFYSGIFCLGLLYTSGMSMAQFFAARRHRFATVQNEG